MTSIDGFDEFAALLDEFADDLDEIADKAAEVIDDGVQTTALQIEASAKRRARVKTGDLRADIKAIRLALGLYSVGSTKEYAPPIEYGSRPHVITPNGPYPLRFKVDGQWVATYKVNHPGHDAYPFLRPSLNEHRDDLIDNIQEEIESLIDSEL
jgi:hypothetical protein